MRSHRIALVASALAVLAVVSARADDPPESGELLAKIDAALWFHDRQPGLTGYKARAVCWQGGEAVPADAQELGRVGLDPATKEKTGVTSWVPGCGPWTLTKLMAFELELFARPWTEQFTGVGWDRSVEASGSGWILHLVPENPIGGQGAPLGPSILGLHVEVDEHGVPRSAVLDLDMQFMQTPGKIGFEYDDAGEKKRIRRITHELSMANLAITPPIDFRFARQGELDLFEGVDFHIAGGELSGTLAGVEVVSRLRFLDYEIEKKE